MRFYYISPGYLKDNFRRDLKHETCNLSKENFGQYISYLCQQFGLVSHMSKCQVPSIVVKTPLGPLPSVTPLSSVIVPVRWMCAGDPFTGYQTLRTGKLAHLWQVSHGHSL